LMVLQINDRIRTRKLEFFTTFHVHLKYDAIASDFKFDYIFNPDNIELKEMSCVAHYHVCYIEHEGKRLLTGYVLSNNFKDSAEANPASLAGYSLTGFLEDCQIIPTQSAPLQSDKLSLREIAEKFIRPFNLSIVIDPVVATAMEEKFDETTAKEKQSIKSYLSELAAQKNIVLSHDELGRLVFTRPSSKRTPVFNFENNIPGVSMELIFNGQGMHSDIIAFQQQDPDEEIPESEFSIKNPYVPFVYRPRSVVQTSGDANDTSNAARNALSIELKGLQLIIDTDRWDVDGVVWKPGMLITAINPRVYLYKKSTWFISDVEFIKTPEKTTCKLTCVIPEVFTGEIPKYLFSGINLH
jgi:prophage tail gpP-like protein